MSTAITLHWGVTRKMVEVNSVTARMKAKVIPPMKAGFIRGSTLFRKVVNHGAPSSAEASSMATSICFKVEIPAVPS